MLWLHDQHKIFYQIVTEWKEPELSSCHDDDDKVACTILSSSSCHAISTDIIKVGDRSQGHPEGSFFNSYYTEVQGRALLLSLDCSNLPLIRTLYCWVLTKEVSSIIFKVFGMMQPGIEPRSPGPYCSKY